MQFKHSPTQESHATSNEEVCRGLFEHMHHTGIGSYDLLSITVSSTWFKALSSVKLIKPPGTEICITQDYEYFVGGVFLIDTSVCMKLYTSSRHYITSLPCQDFNLMRAEHQTLTKTLQKDT